METKDEDERKIILEHKFEAFNFNYLNTITNKIYDTIKDFENGITHVNTKVEQMPQKSDKAIPTSNESVSAYFDKVANYVHECFNIQSLMTPDKMTIFFPLNIGVNDLHQTAISLTFFDEADYQKKIMFNIVKMNGEDTKNSIILKKDSNLISIEELDMANSQSLPLFLHALLSSLSMIISLNLVVNSLHFSGVSSQSYKISIS